MPTISHYRIAAQLLGQVFAVGVAVAVVVVIFKEIRPPMMVVMNPTPARATAT